MKGHKVGMPCPPRPGATPAQGIPPHEANMAAGSISCTGPEQGCHVNQQDVQQLPVAAMVANPSISEPRGRQEERSVTMKTGTPLPLDEEKGEGRAINKKLSVEEFPGAYESKLGSVLNATSTKLSQLPQYTASDEWAVIIAKRGSGLEVWALEDSDGLLGSYSSRAALAFVLGHVLGAISTFVYLAYL
ncbi:hypothetical protein NMY22_g15571 [Coprinellus aureogranulatus]|nr:hypothetical protein NMY22_g15571 [Coprinellus aureogranulatus]